MTDVNTVIDRYFTLWTEPDASRRQDLIETSVGLYSDIAAAADVAAVRAVELGVGVVAARGRRRGTGRRGGSA